MFRPWRLVHFSSPTVTVVSSRSKLGRKPVRSPMRGRNEQTQYTYSMLVRSASHPKTADQIRGIQKAKQKKARKLVLPYQEAIPGRKPGSSGTPRTRLFQSGH